MSIEKCLSADGSLTLFNQDYQESYHSLRDGAIRETMHKHIFPSVRCGDLFSKSRVRILDICFGLGYNSFFTIWHYLNEGYRGDIEIFSPEKDIRLFDELLKMSYPKEILCLDGVEIGEILQILKRDGVFAKNRWKIECYLGDALHYLERFEDGFFDVIYQDAFSPDKNPELWSAEYFQKLFCLLDEGGIITTYSQKSSIKSLVKELGMCVYELQNQTIRNSRIFSKNKLEFDFLRKK